ncbi:hypothetical protein HK099_003840 [Clydaea vesicula]|uniref:Uncharacterized protein n=1 Tax=Clydaea vesicula TaxID=447962 RepID=A0AAD5U322_9FUNG|nr:hypothetical protein HK099_003840 [Clydaea vesicula]
MIGATIAQQQCSYVTTSTLHCTTPTGTPHAPTCLGRCQTFAYCKSCCDGLKRFCQTNPTATGCEEWEMQACVPDCRCL